MISLFINLYLVDTFEVKQINDFFYLVDYDALRSHPLFLAYVQTTIQLQALDLNVLSVNGNIHKYKYKHKTQIRSVRHSRFFFFREKNLLFKYL